MKDDEKQFLNAVANKGEMTVREVIDAAPLHHKRAWYLLNKWSRKGWYEWGVKMDIGWLTPEGKAAAKSL